MTDLVPTSAELADLLTQMVKLPWPTSEQERLRYYDELGLQNTDSSPQGIVNDRVPETVGHSFTVPLLTGVDGSCTMFRGEVLGLGLFCYNRRVENDPQAREAYALLQAALSRTLGAPVEKWGSNAEPACLWQAGELRLDMYCFQRGHSGIMVGLSHSARSAAHDAAAETNDPGRPHPPAR